MKVSSSNESEPLLKKDSKPSTYRGLENSEDADVEDYLSEVSKASSLAPSEPVGLSWEGLNVSVPELKRGILNRCMTCKNGEKKPDFKQILFDINGAVAPGQLVALMGASGAGKTTLLNTLNQRNVKGFRMEGKILANGEELGRSITNVSAYVQQENLFIGTLTVREHLQFQALLRLPRTMTEKQKIRRADELLYELGLKKCKNTKIGLPGRIKGISGGEKRRLSFASEALTGPSIFFCDEPTTGLDSFMAEQVVQFLQKMAQHGKTVICTIHQPPSEVYSMFDRVMLLAEGKTAFFGTASGALDFFKSAKLECPKDYNPADFFIQTLAIIPGQEEKCRKKVEMITDHYQQSSFASAITTIIERNRRYTQTSNKRIVTLKNKSPFNASWLTMFTALLWRATLFNYRNKGVVVVRNIQKVGIGLLVGLIYLGTEYNQRGINDINGALFFFLMQVSMPATMGVLRFLPADFPVLVNEYHNGVYKISAYYWSRVISFIPVFSIDGILYLLIIYFMTHLSLTAEAFFYALLIGVLVEQCSCAFGIMLSVVSPTFAVAVTIGGPIMTLVRMTSGLMANLSTLPPFISWLQWVSWWRYGYEAMLINQWHGLTGIACENPTLSCITTGDQVLARMSFRYQDFSRDVGMLAVLTVAFHIVAYIALWIRIVRAR